MTDKVPADWILIEAAKRCCRDDNGIHASAYIGNPVFRALCDMIERYEQPPVDRKVLCAREALLGCFVPASIETMESAIVRAIELWESGYGK